MGDFGLVAVACVGGCGGFAGCVCRPGAAYRLVVPEELPEAKVPLVMVLHGGAGSAADVEQATGFSELAKKEKFIVVYPEGSGGNGLRAQSWNAGHCCGAAMRLGRNDVAFLSGLVTELVKSQPVDIDRVYLVGVAEGGMMALRLAREKPQLFAGLAVVSAAMFGDEVPAEHAVPVLMINGAKDKLVPPGGGMAQGAFAGSFDEVPMKPRRFIADYWARVNGCGATPVESENEGRMEASYPCLKGREVESLLLKDGEHGWPPKPLDDKAWSASQAIWQFLAAHKRE